MSTKREKARAHRAQRIGGQNKPSSLSLHRDLMYPVRDEIQFYDWLRAPKALDTHLIVLRAQVVYPITGP